MGTKSKKSKTRLDAYYRLAKDQGYRARSAFKLIQLNRKYDFLAKSRVLVDLCAAPGGWLQVAAKYMPIGSKIVGVDLVPIAPIRGCKTFVGDITDDKTRKIIITWLKKEPVDCVIHDGAPNVGGVWSRDLFEQNALVLAATKMAASMLKLGGYFLTKVFRSQDFHKLLWVLKQLFDKVEATKPLASRMESAEIFVICAGYKAPKHIDPAMFNAQKVFADVGEEKILTPSGALVIPKSNVPLGYDEFATISYRVAAFSDFLHADDPKSFLMTHHELRFATDEDKAFLKSKSSRKELVHLCGDLQQVGKADLRRLLRWREQLLHERSLRLPEADKPASGQSPDADEEGSSADRTAGDAGDRAGDEMPFDFDSPEGITRIAQELLEIRKKRSKELKKKQKKLVDRKLKQIKGLINYDPTTNEDKMVDTDDFRAIQGQRDAFSQPDEPGAGADDDADGDEMDGFTVEKLAHIPEEALAEIMDTNYQEPAYTGNDPLNPVMSVDLAAQDDWDLGDAAGEDAEDGTGPPSHQLIEGEEYFMDVDNYGNYVPAKRSARVKLYEEDSPLPDEEEEEEENDPVEAKAVDGKAKVPPTGKHTGSKSESVAKSEAKLANAHADATENPVEVQKGGGKETKWQQHHHNINKILNETFPKGRSDSSSKAGQKRSRAVEEDRIDLKASRELPHSASEDGRKGRGKRNRFDTTPLDDDNEDNSSSSRSNSDDEDVFSDLSEVERDDLDIHEGRVNSRRKRQIVPSLRKLTTQELVREQRKQVLLSNRELRNQKKSKSNKGKKSANEFEEIPVAMTDPDIRARTLAIAQKMLDPKARREILDASINRYVFNDDDDLPDWFVKDEQRNCKVLLPVTAEEIEQQRQRFRELNARPSRKVVEAVARKRRKAQRMLHKLVEKGKEDPRARQKVSRLSVRKLMRSQAIKGAPKKASKYMDKMSFGQRRREKQRLKRQKVRKSGRR